MNAIVHRAGCDADGHGRTVIIDNGSLKGPEMVNICFCVIVNIAICY